MDALHVLLEGLFLSVALALLSGCIYLLVRERRNRHTIDEDREGHRSYVEVWQCPNCNRLSRIARRCKWCMKEMPGLPRFLTVTEREYTDQLLPPRSEPRRNPPGGPRLRDLHP
jgi:hypothetical protein